MVQTPAQLAKGRGSVRPNYGPAPVAIEPDMSDSPLRSSRVEMARKSLLSLNVSRASDTDSHDDSINPDPEVQMEEAYTQLRDYLQGLGLEKHVDQLMQTFSIQSPDNIGRICAFAAAFSRLLVNLYCVHVHSRLNNV
eukprot:106278-Rhodomonas_salina.1